jgi:starch synthase
MNSFKVAIVAAEMTPYAKVGGLADVIGALPAALAQRGAQVSVILPGYKTALEKLKTERIAQGRAVKVGTEPIKFGVLRASGTGAVSMFLIENEKYFGRDGVYGEKGADYPDNLARFIFFGRAAAQVLGDQVEPDVIHAHDWHASVLPIVIRADPALQPAFANTVSVFTIHNLAFQGIYPRADYELLNLAPGYFSIDGLEFFGRMNLMKGAIMLADAASTVSPTYAREVTTGPELGFGLEGVLRARGDRFVGILNGADYNEWNPATDTFVAARYSASDYSRNKAICTRELRKIADFPVVDRRPLVGMVTRMTPQKGFDLLSDALDAIMAVDLQLVILGSGDSATEKRFKQAEQHYRDKLRVIIGFDNPVAHKVQAGCDMFLMPSRFEPCGLTQMYALKYGTAPVVRSTGGLADTVREFDPQTGTGDGFVFARYEPDAIVGALARAVSVFNRPELWQRLVQNCFAADFSWNHAAESYLELFGRLRRTRDTSRAAQ